MKKYWNKIFTIFIALFLTTGQVYSQHPFSPSSILEVEKLSLDDVKSSGELLISQSLGFTKIVGGTTDNLDVLVIAVHGYKSEGYEWVGPITKLAGRYANTYFYRYEWEICPQEAGDELARQIGPLVKSIPGIKRVVLFGHSYGGIVVTYFASELQIPLSVEIHTIAAPLAGYPRIFEQCGIEKSKDKNIIFPFWGSSVHHYQWRTVHKQDNAFNKMPDDPQVVFLQGSQAKRLPETMDGRRLGHNWSITWVIDEYLGIRHSQ